ncbi:hypothetical protein [uncultured Tissierella sp.]|uniref:hypothetical protein n=1 Tax=uncultured Tissierella sp. TaxID=448160 RepID=UPI0028056934|nr:hypothetical protein [uncultured Tissierella sp.]MDU5080536.1 hypothetical protein [Bacillota bacterium]
MDKLFKEEIKNYDLLQLENWIRRCRNEIKKENYLNSNSPDEDYKEAVLDFVEEWKKHYEDNEDIYEKDDFQKAILANGINLDRIVLIMKNGEQSNKVDITESLYNSYLEDQDISIFKNIMDDFKEKRLNKIDDYFEMIDDLSKVDDYKIKIIELIRSKTKYNILTYTTVIDNEEIFKIDNVDELIEAIISSELVEEPATFEILEKEEPFLNSIYEFDITKQVFYDFEKYAYTEGLSNKHFQKKFFINVGLYLSLNLKMFEKLLNLFGYTIEKSKVEEDRLLSEFVYLGLDKEYIDISIEANNLRPLTARLAGYQKRNISYIDEFLKKSSYTIDEIKEFKFTLQYAITKLRSFVDKKEESWKKANYKYEKLKNKCKKEKDQFSIVGDKLELYEYKNYKDEDSYRIKISENNKSIYKLKNELTTSVAEKEKNKNDIKALINENKELTKMANNIKAEFLELKKFRNEQLRKLERTEKSINNTKSKLDKLSSEKYKSIDIFNTHIEKYNNFTLDEVKNLLDELKSLYNKDYLPK